jgi:hypothetical protein
LPLAWPHITTTAVTTNKSSYIARDRASHHHHSNIHNQQQQLWHGRNHTLPRQQQPLQTVLYSSLHWIFYMSATCQQNAKEWASLHCNNRNVSNK